MATELVCVGLAGILVVFYILAPAVARALSSPAWAAGNRDGTAPQTGLRSQRAERAARNILETFPVFAAVTLAVVLGGATSTLSAIGAVLYVVARVAYWPAYVYGLGPLRSMIYGLSMLGIVLELIALLLGAL
ncbi:hypothetical protein DLJ53_23365 [Acuticoccus sediminis]|uniref:MAPEG superfamily protein n=1 Tax=Acuticoccus sediminis TaxID=2184697 RepID=A0A8B2NLQ2_9HYPH|nr:MAPEG family protein [Acuticoccus sediminis]RAH99460.1 hypothetical protein DLJ53_23365 [Acuticoccus sediminis]